MRELSKFGVELNQTRLKNGAPVFLFKRKGMPIHLKAVFYAGSRFDEMPGVAHFLEHMLVAGTEKFPSKNLLADHIQKVGGDFGASTNQDTIKFWIEIPEVVDLGIGIELLNECLTKSSFNSEIIENERGAIFSELKSKKSNPSQYIHDVSRRLAFQNTSIQHGNLGSESDIAVITKDILLNHYKKYIHTGRVVFVVSGGVEMDHLIDQLNEISLPTGEYFRPSEEVPIFNEQKMLIEPYEGMSQLHVVLTRRFIAEDYKELCALWVLNYVLASGRGSRLVTKLRYQNGLVYMVNGSIMNAPDWGRINISFSCDRNNYKEVTDLIYSEFKILKGTGLSESELENVKSRITKGAIRDMQTSASWAAFHENTCLYEPDNVKTIEEYLNTILDLTRSDISDVINKYLNKEDFFVAICGEYKEKASN